MIAAGLGCRRGCSPTDIIQALTRALELEGLAVADVQVLFSVAPKATEAGLHAAAAELGKRLVLLPEATLAAQASGALTASAAVAARFDLPSVAETAALAGAVELAGANGRARLLGPRQVAGGAACALAIGVQGAGLGSEVSR